MKTHAARMQFVRSKLHEHVTLPADHKFRIAGHDHATITVYLVDSTGVDYQRIAIPTGVEAPAGEHHSDEMPPLTLVDGNGHATRTKRTPVIDGRGELKPIWLSDVEAEEVEWLWNKRIPLGKLTLVMGDPGLGKSFWSCDAAARVSTGSPWPDGSPCPQGKVLLFSAEDGCADTIRPRFDKAGGDPTQVAYLNTLVDANGKRLPFALDTDLPKLVELVKAHPEIKMIVIDPISCYLGKPDSHKNAEVRAVLSGLADLAEQLGVAIIVITHLNKNSGQGANHRATGSIAFTAAARAVWLVAEDRDDEADHKRSLFLPIKSNLAPKQPGLAFRIERGRLEWQDGTVDTTPDEALALKSAAGQKMTKQDKAQSMILSLLGNGPMPSIEVYKAVNEAVGCSDRIITMARDAVGAEWFVGEDGATRFMALKGQQRKDSPCVAQLRSCAVALLPGTDDTDRRAIEHVRGIA